MGGLVISDTLLKTLSSASIPILGLIAYDSPLLGLNPAVFKSTFDKALDSAWSRIWVLQICDFVLERQLGLVDIFQNNRIVFKERIQIFEGRQASLSSPSCRIALRHARLQLALAPLPRRGRPDGSRRRRVRRRVL